MDSDKGLESFIGIYTTFGEFCHKRGEVSEADTRAKIIDRILKEVLGWPEECFRREIPVHQGYIDYLLRVDPRNMLLVEAKREGIPFDIPKELKKQKKI